MTLAETFEMIGRLYEWSKAYKELQYQYELRGRMLAATKAFLTEEQINSIYESLR